MAYVIRMGVPEMSERWNKLREEYRSGEINKKDEQLYKKWGVHKGYSVRDKENFRIIK